MRLYVQAGARADALALLVQQMQSSAPWYGQEKGRVRWTCALFLVVNFDRAGFEVLSLNLSSRRIDSPLCRLIFYVQALVAMETHNEGEAIASLKRLHTALPHSTWVLTQLGAAQWAAGRFTQATSTFSQVPHISSTNSVDGTPLLGVQWPHHPLAYPQPTWRASPGAGA